jgi:hypothetical protein
MSGPLEVEESIVTAIDLTKLANIKKAPDLGKYQSPEVPSLQGPPLNLTTPIYLWILGTTPHPFHFHLPLPNSTGS